MIIKLVLGLSLFAVIIGNTRSEDYYRDEQGNIYTIGQWGERRYGGGGYFSQGHSNFRVDGGNILTFGWNLFKNIDSENFAFSPLSPQILLSALTKETNNQSESYTELTRNVLYKDSKPLEELIRQMLGEATNRELKIANAFFVKEDPELKKSFYDIAPIFPESPENKTDFPDISGVIDIRHGGEKQKEKDAIRPMDLIYTNFQQPEVVKRRYKNWVDKSTKGVIKNAEIEVDSDTEMILASTIYFKGQWLFAFEKTEKIKFTLPNKKKIEVDAMKIRKKYHSGTFSDLPARWAAIPYNSTEALVIVMPNKNENINDLISKMKGTEMTEIIDDLSGPPTSNWLNITLPKFKITSKIDLKKPLEKMGIRKIFTDDAQLQLYEEGRGSRIAAVTQQSSLEIDEEGSIGASATAFSVVALSIQRESHDTELIVDRPFIAVIIDRKYGVPYFIAKITNPSLQN